MNPFLFGFLIFASFVIIGTGCQKTTQPRDASDELLARVYNRYLYQSEIQDLFPPGQNPEDSLLRANAQIERWVRDALLMHEAERNIPKDLNIDQLVRDYRASLVLHNYEQQLILSTLDSIITQEELEVYYRSNKDQYPLEQPLLLPSFLVIPLALEARSELEGLWNAIDENGNREELKGLCDEFGIDCLLDNSVWMTEQEVIRLFPEGALQPEQLIPGKSHRTTDSLYVYHLAIAETLSSGDVSPLPVIEDQIRMVIIHKRRLNILEERAEDLYDLESRRGNVEIY